MAAKAILDGCHSVTTYLMVKGADRAIDFYKKVFGAAQRIRMDGPNGTVGHAEIEIDGSTIMLADEFPDMGFRSPKSLCARRGCLFQSSGRRRREGAQARGGPILW